MDIENIARLAMNEGSVSVREAADRLGLGTSTVSLWCRKLLDGERSRLKPEEVTTDPAGRYRVSVNAVNRLLTQRQRFKF